MAESTTPSSGGVFISYRREDASGMAGRLYDRLAARFGEDQVFMDVDRIGLGVDFAEVISQAVSTCDVLIAVIGQRWLTAIDEDNKRRLDDPDDFVRLEIEAALARDIRVFRSWSRAPRCPAADSCRTVWRSWPAAMPTVCGTRAFTKMPASS
jgi:hypothetical protein